MFSSCFTSYLELRAAHPSQLAVDRVYFLDQGDQDGVTDPLHKTNGFYCNLWTVLCFFCLFVCKYVWTLTFLSLAVQLSMQSITGRLVVILAHTYSTHRKRKKKDIILCKLHILLWHRHIQILQISFYYGTTTNHTMLMYRPPLQPAWSPDLSHLCGQKVPESGRLAGTKIFSDSGRNLPLSGCSSKMLDCGLETQTLDFL